MNVVIISSQAISLTLFRGDLILTMIEAGCEVTALAPDYDELAIEGLSAIGANFRTFRLNRAGINPLHDAQAIINIRSILNEIQPDLVFCYTVKPVIYGLLAARLAKVPNRYGMITGLGYAFGGNSLKQKLVGWVVRNLFKLSLAQSREVFFQNPDDRNLFTDLGIVSMEKTVVVNGSGVNLDTFDEVPAPDQDISFLLIARLIWEKGIGIYADASRQLKTKYPNVQFNLLGHYDKNPTAIQRSDVEQWVADGFINYLGKTDDVRPYLAKTSVFVLPTYYREGTPRSILEAMSTGRAIITTDAPGCRETVISGQNGYLIPIKDVDALVDAMEKFIIQSDMIKTMGTKSRQFAEEKFDVHKVNKQMLTTMKIIPHG